MKEQIGTNAGIIWKILVAGETTDFNVEKLKKVSHLKSPDFFMALGWLARENKVKFLDGSKSVYIFPHE